MAKTVEQLLRKKKFTGQEVGQAYLITLAAQKKAQREGKEFKPPFTRADLDRMENSLQTREQYSVFRVYSAIYRALVDAANMTEANIQQVYNGYYRLIYTLKDCMQADTALKAVESYPLIMTQGQLDQIIKELTEERRSFNTSFYSIVAEYIQDQVLNLEQAPKAIKEAIEALKQEPCTNERILRAYKEEYGAGYYMLPDGRRSDDMSFEEWQQLLQDRFLDTHKYTVDGEEASPEETIRFYNSQRLLQAYKLFFADDAELEAICKEKGIKLDKAEFTLDELREAAEELIELKGSYKLNMAADKALKLITEEVENGLEWHYKEPEEALSKYDVLLEHDLFCRYSGGMADDVEEREQFLELERDYPALYTAACKEVLKLLPRAAKLKKEDYLQPIFTYGEVADSGLTMYDYFLKDFTDHDIIDFYCNDTDSTEALQKRRRIMYSGLAIIRETPFTKHRINDNGEYTDTVENPYLLLESIDSITDDEDRIEDVRLFREHLVEPALRFIYAYNVLLDLLAAVYDTESIKELKTPTTSYIEGQIEAYNNLLYMFYGSLYGTPEEKARKRKLIKQVFKPIEVNTLKPEAAAVQKVKEKLEESCCKSEAIKLLHDLLPLIMELQERGA